MSYNHGPMISKDIFDEYLAPYYRQFLPLLKERNIIPIVDTDGDVTRMVPWLLEVGFAGVLPLERQAKVDGNRLREAFPALCMIGHYDKMVMNQGEAAMRAEFKRLLPLMRSGGFIPSVDHQTPPGSLSATISRLSSLAAGVCPSSGGNSMINVLRAIQTLLGQNVSKRSRNCRKACKTNISCITLNGKVLVL